MTRQDTIRRRVVHFSKNIFSKNYKNLKSKKILLHNLYFLTIVFASKRPLLRYNMTIDYECKNNSMKYLFVCTRPAISIEFSMFNFQIMATCDL
jgi:hypothetical protein